MSTTVETATAIRPFRVDISDEALEDLRRRVAATNWPDKKTVADQSQGVPLAESIWEWRNSGARVARPSSGRRTSLTPTSGSWLPSQSCPTI
jgi:hypothetical protein